MKLIRVTTTILGGALNLALIAGAPAAASAPASAASAPAAPASAASSPASAAATCRHPEGELTVDGGSGFVATTVPGLSVCYTFVGRVGQVLSIGLYIPLPDGSWLGYASRATVFDPEGTVVAIYSAESPQVAPTFKIPVPTLARAGTYTLVLAPIRNTSTLRVASSVSTRRIMGATLIDGPGWLVTYDRVGQEKDLHFSGTAERLVALRVTDFNLTTRQPRAAPGLWIEVYRPQSGAVAYRGVAFGPGDFAVGPLRENGQFTIRTWPLDGSLGRATVGVTTLTTSAAGG